MRAATLIALLALAPNAVPAQEDPCADPVTAATDCVIDTEPPSISELIGGSDDLGVTTLEEDADESAGAGPDDGVEGSVPPVELGSILDEGYEELVDPTSRGLTIDDRSSYVSVGDRGVRIDSETREVLEIGPRVPIGPDGGNGVGVEAGDDRLDLDLTRDRPGVGVAADRPGVPVADDDLGLGTVDDQLGIDAADRDVGLD